MRTHVELWQALIVAGLWVVPTVIVWLNVRALRRALDRLDERGGRGK